jgi:hypothetical protein
MDAAVTPRTGAPTRVLRLDAGAWNDQALAARGDEAQLAVEQGHVLHLPALPFRLDAAEEAVLDPRHADPRRKNISLEADGASLRGVLGSAELLATTRSLIARFQADAATLAQTLFPSYRGRLRAAPASLRLHAVEHRAASWRHDDSRLHIDAFPSRPLAGERILRVFLNIHPRGEPRVWRVGETFESVAAHFWPRLAPYRPLLAAALQALHATKGRRTPYDHFMLGLHDAMKADLGYQRDCLQQTLAFAPGSAWVCFSDQTSHAVMSGQHMLEQTFFLPPAAMRHATHAPLAVLERLAGHHLV